MLKVFRFFLIVLVIVTFVGCKKSQQPQPPVYKVSAIIGGYKWYQNTYTCTLLIDTTHAARILHFSSSSGGKTITFEFINYGVSTTVNPGTYNFPDAYFSYDDDQGAAYNTVSGYITISSMSGNAISGTFDYTVQDANTSSQVHIANGKLVNVAYSVEYQ